MGCIFCSHLHILQGRLHPSRGLWDWVRGCSSSVFPDCGHTLSPASDSASLPEKKTCVPRLPGSWVHFPSRAGAGRGRTDDCPKTSVVAFKSLHPQWITGIWSRHHVLKRKRDGRTEGRGLDIRRSGWEGALRGPVGQLNLSFTRLGITRLCLDRCNHQTLQSVSLTLRYENGSAGCHSGWPESFWAGLRAPRGCCLLSGSLPLRPSCLPGWRG